MSNLLVANCYTTTAPFIHTPFNLVRVWLIDLNPPVI